MVRCRFILTLSLIALWLTTPALACLPNSQMSTAEMECCKKMAGDCHMGAREHPCCETIRSAPQPVAQIQAMSKIQPPVLLVEIVVLSVPAIIESYSLQLALGLPPPAPPGLHAILRI